MCPAAPPAHSPRTLPHPLRPLHPLHPFLQVAGPRLGLRRVCALNLAILAAAVAAAALAFGAIPASGGPSDYP